MSHTQAESGKALVATGIVAAGVLAARSAQAQANPPAPIAQPAHVTLYFAAAPAANGETQIQIPNSAAVAGASPDIQVVNFALAIETAEAELYRQCLARLTTGGTFDNLGVPISGLGLTTADSDVSFVTEFIQVETAQRDFFATQLYGSAAANPFLPGTAATAYKYAFAAFDGTQGVGNFTRLQCIQALYIAELRGIAAYLGGSQALSVGSPFLKFAAAALGVEARHASSHAISLTRLGVPTETAPLPTQNGGRDVAQTADQILNGNGGFGPSTVPGGVIPVASGPNGFVYQ